ncbi:hypothetical protein GCM10023082_25930 [Streptomyces tremellae]|uniref:Uncharacterized protein n=1 Tax=Streptomyces tremellae TaxID=1124239 RepID=A0ABP7EX13_9ACTN
MAWRRAPATREARAVPATGARGARRAGVRAVARPGDSGACRTLRAACRAHYAGPTTAVVSGAVSAPYARGPDAAPGHLPGARAGPATRARPSHHDTDPAPRPVIRTTAPTPPRDP